MLMNGCWRVVGGWWLRLSRLLFLMGVVVGLGDLLVHGAGQGSSILSSVVHASQVGRAREERQGRYYLGRLGRYGIGAVGEAPGAVGRWILGGLGRIDSIRSRVAIG